MNKRVAGKFVTLEDIISNPAGTLDFSPIIILGMHRSGTSLLSRILTQLNVHMGKVLDPNHESTAFKEMNKALLGRLNCNWVRPHPFVDKIKEESFFSESMNSARLLMVQWSSLYGSFDVSLPWGWKDPRNSLTLPVWLAMFPNAKVIHMIRNGIDVALSLARREPRRYLHRTDVPRLFPPTIMQGYRLWEQYLTTICQYENLTSNTQWLSIYYESLVQHPTDQIRNLVSFLGLDVPQEQLEKVVAVLVRHPTPVSVLERQRVRFLIRLNVLNLALLKVFYGEDYLAQRLA